MRSKAALGYSLLFFLSGATGLVYELLWVRLLYQAFGSTIQSVTTVVAAYMGGLGLGAWYFGTRGDRHPRPAALYGWLEIAIGVFGVLSPLVLWLAHAAYIGLAGSLHPGPAASVALRFGLAALVLLVPTTLMGGTLPVLTRAFVGADRAGLRRALGRLYGLNTLGAVVGTALAGFFLIEHVGIRASLLATAAVNLALGGAAIAFSRPLAPVPSPTPARATGAGRDRLRTACLVLLALTAFASLLDEIAWTRVLVMIVGGSTYAFTLILLTFLLGIGLGSAAIARSRAPAHRRETAATAALAQAVTAVGAALLFLFFSALPSYIIAVFQLHGLGATERLLLMGVAVGGVVLIPAIGMGMTFPLLTDLAAGPEARAADVGRAYALNAGGSIAGAVLTGFVLVVWLGTDLTLRLGTLLTAGAALGLAWFAAHGVAEGSEQHGRLRLRVVAAGVLATSALAAAFAAPRWSTRLIDLGPTIYARDPMNQAARRAFLVHAGVRQVAFQEGRNATVSVWESGSGRTLKLNGKADASDYGDMDTQILAGLAPAAARPNPTSALVIGFGSGVTARVLADVPGMQRVRIVEIEPAVLAMSQYFTHVNDSVLARPTVSADVDDARSALQLLAERFDVVVSEPSNPWVAGVATLYTPEFFRIVGRRLSEDGVFCQWVQLYQLPLPVVAGIVRNVRSVFPHVQVWFSWPGDLMVLGSAHAFHYDRRWLETLLGPRGALGRLGREYLGVDAPEDYFGHFLLGDAGVARLVERVQFSHEDDRPQLEFVAARRFLDSEGAGGVFDSLVAIGQSTAAPERSSPLLLAKALIVRRGDPAGLPYVDAVRRARPREALWTVNTAAMWLSRGDTTFADSALARLVAVGESSDALLLSGLVALRRDQTSRARTLLTRALAAGADTAEARGALAAVAAREQRWAEVVPHARAAFRTARGTIRHPYPRDWLTDALTRLALEGPPPEADSLTAEALDSRPAWAKFHELRAVAALRAGRCEEAAAQFVTLLDFGIVRDEGPGLVARCRRNQPF